MDTVPTSQPSQDGDYLFNLAWDRNVVAGLPAGSSQLGENGDMDSGIADPELDFVPSSQPSQDGEESFFTPHRRCTLPASIGTHSWTPPSNCELKPVRSVSIGALSRGRLVRRTSPVKSSPASSLVKGDTSRSLNLVRRVTKGPSEQFLRASELDRKRERARQRAQHRAKRIETEIRSLTKTTARLRREHKRLRTLLVTESEDKENSFWA
ncbi:hypothetical protein K438DRAFT_1977933 [Mycena galopus ATCC 62051]|nr:hypothetical protein K438DRAFT_1977933 [Mycena galopus ATCC 62051]